MKKYKSSASTPAVLSHADSIWMEYETSRFTNSTLAAPLSVKDSTVKCQVTLKNLTGDSVYNVRGKLRYRNAYYDGESLTVRFTRGLSKPTISFNGTLLTFSATSGNQWYINNLPLPGTTGQTLKSTTQGIYTVQQKLNACASAQSDGFSYTTTAINDPVLAETVKIFPNPVSTILWIQNKQKGICVL